MVMIRPPISRVSCRDSDIRGPLVGRVGDSGGGRSVSFIGPAGGWRKYHRWHPAPSSSCILGHHDPDRLDTYQMRQLHHRLLALALLGTATLAQAAFPDKPVKIIVASPAGGPLDAHARLMADRLQSLLGQPIIVDYKAGAGGTVGA